MKKKIERKILAAVISVGILITVSGAGLPSSRALAESMAEKESDAAEQQQAKCSFEQKTGCLTFHGPGVITGDIGGMGDAGMKYPNADSWGTGVFWGTDSGDSIDIGEVKSIVIEEGVTEIGEGVFTYLPGLKSVTIGDSVTKIGAGAFGCCRSLEEITIGNGVTDIGASAFADCDAIRCITFGNSVKNLGERFLGEAPNLEKIIVAEENEYLKIKGNLLYSKDGKELYLSPKKGLNKVTVAEGTEVIKQLAFSSAALNKVMIPASVQVLEAGAFYLCKNLKSVTFAKGSECLRTEEYYRYFGDGVEEYYTAFRGCKKLKSISFGNKLEILSANTFDGCIKLESIHLGKNFKGFSETGSKKLSTSMGQGNLNAFKKITVTKSNPRFCSEKGVLYSKSKKKLCMYPNGKKTSSYTVADSVQVIGECAFGGNDTLQKVVFGTKVKEVEAYAFGYCGKLTAVDMKKKLTRIGERAFTDCSRLSDVCWSRKVEYVGDYAFLGCARLKSIVFRDGSDVVVCKGAFKGCRNVTKVVWPKGFDKIGANAFKNCKKISEAVLAGKGLNISTRAFSDCVGLKKLTIKSGVAKLGEESFYGCESLHSVFVPKSVKSIEREALAYMLNRESNNTVKIKPFQIKGKKGSQAQKYAKANKITFVIK